MVGACCARQGRTLFQGAGKAFKDSLNADAKGRGAKGLAPDQIAIGVIRDDRGRPDLTYVPFLLRVPPGTTVSFVSWDGKFELTPRRRSADQVWPFGDSEATLKSDGTPDFQYLTLPMPGRANPGWYTFRVKLMVQGADGGIEDTIRDEYCPSIIVEEVDGGLPPLDIDARLPSVGAVDAGS
jgi:hypothetical protein